MNGEEGYLDIASLNDAQLVAVCLACGVEPTAFDGVESRKEALEELDFTEVGIAPKTTETGEGREPIVAFYRGDDGGLEMKINAEETPGFLRGIYEHFRASHAG